MEKNLQESFVLKVQSLTEQFVFVVYLIIRSTVVSMLLVWNEQARLLVIPPSKNIFLLPVASDGGTSSPSW